MFLRFLPIGVSINGNCRKRLRLLTETSSPIAVTPTTTAIRMKGDSNRCATRSDFHLII